MTTHVKKEQRLTEFKYKPIMSAWFAWKSGGTSTRYSFELRNSLKEIRYRGETPNIDFDYGFQSLVNLIEEYHKGKFIEARIYGHKTDNENVLIRKYVFNKITEKDELIGGTDKDPNFNSPTWLKTKDKLIQDLYITVRNSQIVTSVLNGEILK